jgi:hypothetical protein
MLRWLVGWLDPPLSEQEERAIDEALRRCPVQAYPWLDWCSTYPHEPDPSCRAAGGYGRKPPAKPGR